ncbi:MAG TPA: PepSY domain-containing protein [Bellilinea sp.]|nr:PepSY domain-containing protein [Bellilinea sp.]
MSTRKMFFTFVAVLLLAGLFIGVDAWNASAQGPNGNNPPCGGYGWNTQGGMMGHMGGWNNHHGMMNGGGYWDDCAYGNQMGPMMGGWNNQGPWGGPGMMNGWGNQQGWNNQNSYPYGGYGMMGGWTPPAALAPAATTLSLDEAVAIAEAYMVALNNPGLTLGEVMQFNNNFYAQAVEVDGDRGAFEFLIDPTTGTVYPEPGPNMMWNARYGMQAGYGMMGQWNAPAGANVVDMTVSPEQARQSAQQFLDTWYAGWTVASEADTFYGYYTFEVLQGENIVGMLSVNGYTGQVWPHTWHGEFVAATTAAD